MSTRKYKAVGIVAMIVVICVGGVVVDKNIKDFEYQEQVVQEALMECGEYLRSVREGRWYLDKHPRVFEANNNCSSISKNWEEKVKAVKETENGVWYVERRREENE